LELVAPTKDDVVITLGDYIDRGPDSAGVIDLLLELEQSSSLIALRGNHECMMLDSLQSMTWRESWLKHGGIETLASYGIQHAEPDALNNIPTAHLSFIENRLLPFWECASSIYVHAFAEPNKFMTAQSDASLFWRKFINPEPHMSGKTVICGHTPQHNGFPVRRGGWVCIDTFVYDAAGWLTCFDVDNNIFWQANEMGATRQFALNPVNVN